MTDPPGTDQPPPHTHTLATAVTLDRAGEHNIETSRQAAEALRPLAGEAAYVLFGLGLIGTGLPAIPVLAGAIVSRMVLDLLEATPIRMPFQSSVVNGLLAPSTSWVLTYSIAARSVLPAFLTCSTEPEALVDTIRAGLRLREDRRLLSVWGACPRCGVEQEFPEGQRLRRQQTLDGPRCDNRLTLTADAGVEGMSRGRRGSPLGIGGSVRMTCAYSSWRTSGRLRASSARGSRRKATPWRWRQTAPSPRS